MTIVQCCTSAFKLLLKEFPNISLSIVGSGDFSQYQEKYSILKNVRVINRWIKDEEVGGFFKGKNIVTVLPYVDATQSGVIGIAMNNNSVVIASRIGGISEQIEEETGFLIEPNKVEDLYHKMKYVIEHNDHCNIIKRNAKRTSEEMSWYKISSKLGSVIDEI